MCSTNQATIDPCYPRSGAAWVSLVHHHRVISFLATQLKILIFMTARRERLRMTLDNLVAGGN